MSSNNCTSRSYLQKLMMKLMSFLIVGDPHSNNTKKLASIAHEKANKDTYMIESD